jgi:hypothetical protein
MEADNLVDLLKVLRWKSEGHKVGLPCRYFHTINFPAEKKTAYTTTLHLAESDESMCSYTNLKHYSVKN